MIKWLAVVVAVLASNASHAAIYDAVITGVTKTGTQWAIKSPSATVNAGAVQTFAKVPTGTSTVNVSGGGISVTGGEALIPVVMALAPTAGKVALTAIRLNPAGLVVGLTAQWLLSQGLQYANNQWFKNTEGTDWADNNTGAYRSATPQEVAAKWCPGESFGRETVYSMQTPTDSTMGFWCSNDSTGHTARRFCTGTMQQWSAAQSCPAVQRGATESDFDGAAPTVTDGAVGELLGAGVELPVNPPTFGSSDPVDASSAPYLDPVSGRKVKDTARITPSPTAENPLQVRVERYQEDAGAVPGQTTAPPAPTKEASISNQPMNIQFPSDYARQGEAHTAATSINDTLGPKLDKITETGADPTDPLQPQNSEFDQAFFQGTFTNLLGWQLPAHTSQCPTSTFNWNGQSFTIDSHCQMVQDHFSGLSAVMLVVWSILALFILLGA